MAASARHPRLLRAFPSWVISLHRTANKKLRPHEYAFKVPRQMTKFDVKEYLETVYGVKVAEVQTVNYDGKIKRYPLNGKEYRTKAVKKAYVRLALGKDGKPVDGSTEFHWNEAPAVSAE